MNGKKKIKIPVGRKTSTVPVYLKAFHYRQDGGSIVARTKHGIILNEQEVLKKLTQWEGINARIFPEGLTGYKTLTKESAWINESLTPSNRMVEFRQKLNHIEAQTSYKGFITGVNITLEIMGLKPVFKESEETE